MQRISDALELLTAQHDAIDALIVEITEANPERRIRAITELADRLTIHLAAEQELFYPAVSTLVSVEVHTELLAEHSEIKRVLADLVWLDGDDPRLALKLSALQALIDCHTMWQERDLFEKVAEARTPDELSALGSEITGWIDSIISVDDRNAVDDRTAVAA